MKSLINKTLDLFSSLKLTILLFIIMLFYLAISTFIPQESENLIDLSRSKPAVSLILKSLGLFNPYHNLLIILILLLFTFNLVACTLSRLPPILKRISKNRDPSYFNIDSLIKIGITATDDKHKDILEKIQRHLRNKFSRHHINGEDYLIFKRGIYSPLNFIVVHLSILIIVAGISVSSAMGYKGFIRLSEGRYEEFFNREITKGNYVREALPFKMRLNKFENITISNGMSVDYISDITILGEGETNIKIRVNEPFEYKGMLFVQSSYERDIEGAEFTIEFESRDKERERVRVSAGEDFTAFGRSFRIADFYENVHNMGPAIKLISDDDIIFALRDRPEVQREDLGLNIYLKDLRIPYSSILRVSYDPGTGIVFFGSVVFILSLLLVLFYRFDIVVIRLSKNAEVYCSPRIKETLNSIINNREV